MTTPISLDRILALNDELSALAAAGVPVDLGQRAQALPVDRMLEEAGASIALLQGRGRSLQEAVTDNPDLPPGYRSALMASMKSSQLTMTLEACCHPAAALAEVRHVIGRALMGSLIVIILAYCGFLFLCLYVTPTFADQYHQLGTEPSSSVLMLTTARLWLPYWASLAPLLLLSAILLWRHGGPFGRATRWLPSLKRYEKTVRDAQFADSLSQLVQQNIPLTEALRWSSRITGQPARIEAVQRVALAMEGGEPLTPNHPNLASMSPVLRWALSSYQASCSDGSTKESEPNIQSLSSPSLWANSLSVIPLANNLQFAAQTGRRQVQRRLNFWRVAAPAAGYLFIAGPVTLLYALCLFEPLVQLWKDLGR